MIEVGKVGSIAVEGTKGFLEGMGLDWLMRCLAEKVPVLKENSPIPAPPGYLPGYLHWDDVISLIAAPGAVAAIGFKNKNIPMIAEGIAIALGSYVMSTGKYIGYRPVPYPAVSAVSTAIDIVKVD